MGSLRNTLFEICITLLIPLALFSQSYEEQKPFFTDLEKEVIEEYHTCTGDTGNTDISYILRWKKSINLRTEDPAYKKILKEFILHTGIVKDVVPCEVLKWNRDRIAYLKKQESSIGTDLVEQSDSIVDSVAIHQQLARNHPSPCDFDTIPFGITKELFHRIFARKYPYPVVNRGRYLLVEHFPLRGSFFNVKFFFTRKHRRLYKYEIEGYGFPGDSLDTVIRPQAEQFKDIYEKRLGKPDVLNRIGFFDIKADTVSTYVQWKYAPHTVTVGMGIKDDLYYSLVSVVNEQIDNK